MSERSESKSRFSITQRKDEIVVYGIFVMENYMGVGENHTQLFEDKKMAHDHLVGTAKSMLTDKLYLTNTNEDTIFLKNKSDDETIASVFLCTYKSLVKK